MGRPAHATWYVPRVSLPPALQALTCRLGAAARPCNVRACSHPRTLPLGRRAYTIYCFWIRDAKMGRPAHATWYVPRVSVPPALQALTWRLGAAAHPCNVRACSHPRTLPLAGDAPTLYNVFGSAMPRWAGRPMPLGMCLEYAYHPLCKLLHVG